MDKFTIDSKHPIVERKRNLIGKWFDSLNISAGKCVEVEGISEKDGWTLTFKCYKEDEAGDLIKDKKGNLVTTRITKYVDDLPDFLLKELEKWNFKG